MEKSTTDTPISILLIEDDKVDVQGVLREFKRLDAVITFHIAQNGVEALDKLYGRNDTPKLDPPPHAIILDTNMPKMDGIEFLTILRADSAFDDIHIFMLTGEYSTREKLESNNIRVTGRIVKPLQFDDVLNIYWVILGRPI